MPSGGQTHCPYKPNPSTEYLKLTCPTGTKPLAMNLCVCIATSDCEAPNANVHGLSQKPDGASVPNSVGIAPVLFFEPENINTSPITAIMAIMPRITSATPLCSSSIT